MYMFVCPKQIISGLEKQSNSQLFSLFPDCYIDVPKWYTNMVASY